MLHITILLTIFHYICLRPPPTLATETVQVEVGEPEIGFPRKGRVEVCVSCSNSLFPTFDERSSGEVNAFLGGALARSMRGVGGKATRYRNHRLP